MHAPGAGFEWALLFAVVFSLLGFIPLTKGRRNAWTASTVSFVLNLIVLFFVNTIWLWSVMPIMSFTGLLPLVLLNVGIALVITAIGDGLSEGLSAAPVMAGLIFVIALITLVVNQNSGHDAYRASHLVPVVQEAQSQLPASSTAQLVIVPPDVATNKASQAMSNGIAGQRNYNTLLTLGPATLQSVNGQMVYVFPLEFNGAINKRHLDSVNPGYMMVSATDPDATVVEHYDGLYSMIVSLGNGQGGDPIHWARDHGYGGYGLEDPTLELNDQGLPFYTVTLLRPQLGMTFYAPVGELVINAHTGQITRYAIGHTPAWLDLVYSQSMAQQIVNWYGYYDHAGFCGMFNIGCTKADRLQVSGSPVLTYTGGSHPVWRMLLTSFEPDASVSKIVEMNAATGTMHVYTPQQPMGVESTVLDAFNNASGTGASGVRANHYVAEDLGLHVIDGHLTWMAAYVPEGVSNPSFVGVGFVDAYHAQADNVVFGSTKAAALQNYLAQLAAEASANGNAPGSGGQFQIVKGTIAAVSWDITGGQKFWYITLVGDSTHAYIGTEADLGPAIVFAQPGQSVTMSVYNVGLHESTMTINSFTDKSVPLTAPGS